METRNASGRVFAIIVGAWMILKTIINSIIGDLSVRDLIVAIIVIAVGYIGVKYTNYVIAGYMALIVFIYIGANIKGIMDGGHTISYLIYLAEGVADIALAICLCVAQNVKEHFTYLPSGNSSSGE